MSNAPPIDIRLHSLDEPLLRGCTARLLAVHKLQVLCLLLLSLHASLSLHLLVASLEEGPLPRQKVALYCQRTAL